MLKSSRTINGKGDCIILLVEMLQNLESGENKND